jgi:hypothetical protein
MRVEAARLWRAGSVPVSGRCRWPARCVTLRPVNLLADNVGPLPAQGAPVRVQPTSTATHARTRVTAAGVALALVWILGLWPRFDVWNASSSHDGASFSYIAWGLYKGWFGYLDVYDHYLLVPLPALVLLTAPVVAGLFPERTGLARLTLAKPLRGAAVVAALLSAGLLTLRTSIEAGTDGRGALTKEHWAWVLRGFYADSLPENVSLQQLSACTGAARAATPSGTPVLATGPQIYVLLGQRAPTRQIFVNPMTAYLSGHQNDEFARRARERPVFLGEPDRIAYSHLPVDFVDEVRTSWRSVDCAEGRWWLYFNPRADERSEHQP